MALNLFLTLGDFSSVFKREWADLADLAQQLAQGQLDKPAWTGARVVLKTRPALGVAQEVPQTGGSH